MNDNKDSKTGKYIGTLWKLDKDLISNKIKNGSTLKSIAQELKVSPGGLRNFLIKNDIQYSKKIKYFSDDSFFDQNNEISFYWAGFIAADGNISKKSDFTLSLKLSDYDHIEKFKKAIHSTAPIVILPPKIKIINKIKTKTSGTALIRFRNNKWINSLIRFNIVPNKTKTYSIPKEIVNNNNFKHFIRGYFDGDGWFSIKKKTRLCFGLCGNYSVLNDIRNFLKEKCYLESLPSIYKQNKIWKFEFQNQHDVYKISDFLFNDSQIYLERKFILSKLAKQFDDNTIILNLEKSELIEAHNRLKSYNLMAKEFNCAKSTIAKYMKKYNLTENK